MTRVSDLPENEWRAHRERVRRTLESADETLDRLAARADRRAQDGTNAAERAEARTARERERTASALPKPVPTPQRAPARDWQAEERWVRQIVDKETKPLAEEVGAICGKLERRIRDLEDRLEQSDAAVTDLMMELERRLATLEGRAVLKPVKPRLVGGGDGPA